MTTVLNIAGHGLKPDGSFDPGAKGFIAKGEHNYMAEDFFPAMKRHIPKDSKLKFEFYTKRNVLHYGDIVSLANSYGKDTIVIEYHYDAFTAIAKGGHVIIWHKFKPDTLDLRLRDAIGSMVGLRFEHMGQKGISGRDNLGNARMTANGGVNYRLIELGFGTNKENAKVMTENIDQYAKLLVEAILETEVDDQPKTENKPVEVVKPVTVKPVAKPSTSIAGAKLVKNENAYFLATENIKVRSQPTTKATHTGTFPKGASLNYNRVFEGNGYRWLEYTGNSGNTLYIPYRRLSGDTSNWGTFHASRPQSTTAIKVGDKVTASRLYGSGADTSADRTTPITGYVEKISNRWKNQYRLVKTKGKTDYLGFARKEHLSK